MADEVTTQKIVVPVPSPRPPEPDAAAVALLVELARGLTAYGTPAHRLEEALGACARQLGVKAEFFSMPTGVFASLGEGSANRTHLLRIEPGGVDLARLRAMGRVINGVLAGEMKAEEGLTAVREALGAPARYGLLLTIGSFAVVSGCAARFFGGGRNEVLAGTLAGLLIGLILVYGTGNTRVAKVLEFAAATVAALVAYLCATYAPPAAPETVLLAGLITLVPGLTFTLAVNELATRHWVSGTARLMGAVTTFIVLGFGVAVAQYVAGLWGLASSGTSDPLPGWTLPAAILITAWPLTVLFKARPRDVGVITVAALVAFYGARAGTQVMGNDLGAFFGALVVGVVANVYARVTSGPAAVVMLPGILLLVPGSIGLRSVSSFFGKNVLGGVEGAATVVEVAIGLVAGLLLANVLVPAKRLL